MTTSEPAGAFVWVWLPGAVSPVVAGRVQKSTAERDPALLFAYGQSYLARPEAISLFTPELPLRPGTFDPSRPLDARRQALGLAGCLRDSAPDAWGRRVLNLRVGADPDVELDELTYLLHSASDRIGALDFQESASTFVPRGGGATLAQLVDAAALVEAGEPIPDDLAAAAGHGTSIGGARPKALLTDGSRQWVAKFASSTDSRPVVRAEGAAMLLARRVGITVPRVEVISARGRDVLLVERFDRTPAGGRRQVISALTVVGEDEFSARHSSYPRLAEAITELFDNPGATLEELFRRLVFSVAIGNTDDHLRNHAAFWDGRQLSLTPAYDLTPRPRSGTRANQAIAITAAGERASQLRLCLKAAPAFHLSGARARGIVDEVVGGIEAHWADAADEARLSTLERDTLMGREILNPYIFEAES